MLVFLLDDRRAERIFCRYDELKLKLRPVVESFSG